MKKILSVVLALTMLVGLLSAYGTMTVSAAAEAGTLPSNAIVLTAGKWYTKGWTNQNYNLNCYNKIVVKSKGYITFTASKPYDSEGEIGSYYLTLMDSNGNEVWETNTEPQKSSFNEYYVYKIGVAPGTYYMNIDPSFYVFRNSATIYTSHKYTFTASSYWEVENNDTQSDATPITLGKTYYGVYTDESYRTVFDDYFKVKLTKGYKYRFTLGNYAKLEAGTLIEEIIGPDGEDVLPYKSKSSGSSEYWEFVAPSTGYYYPLLRNDGNDAGVEYTLKLEHIKYKASECTATLSKTAYTYDGAVKSPSVTVKGPNGNTLKKGTDYTVTYASGRKNAGTYKVTVTYKGAYTGSKTLTFKINPIKVDKCKLKLAATEYTYNGSAKTPSVTVKAPNGKTLKKGTDYTVTYASGRKNPGTYKVTVKMKGNYTGSKTLTFKINPPKTGVSKLTPGKKTIAVSITKKSSGVSGYQVQYSTSKSFANATTKTISSYNTTKYTIKSLKTGKTYYVRVRTFKTVNGKKVYSDWSVAKSAKVK